MFSVFCFSNASCDYSEDSLPTKTEIHESKATASASSTSGAVSLSMVVWGVVAAVGIAALAVFVNTSEGDAFQH